MLPARKRFRSRANYLLACASEAMGPLLRRIAATRTGPPRAANEWRRGIILGADHIGDVLYNTTSLAPLKQGLPDCEWHYVADPPASEVLAGNPYLAGVVTREELKALPPKSFDVALCYNSGETWRDLWLVTKLGIPNRIGYPDKGFSSLVTFPIRIDYPQPYPAYFRDLVGQIIRREPDWPLRPRIYPGAPHEAAAQKIWTELRLDDEHAVIACFATSRQRSGVWPARKFAETLALLESEGNCRTILCGAAAEKESLTRLRAELHLSAPVLAGELDLLSLGCFLGLCDVVLCPDSGPRHLANAAGTPVVFVRNVAVGKIETGAYGATEIDAAPNLECIDDKEQPKAFDLIQPQEIARVIAGIIAEQRIHFP